MLQAGVSYTRCFEKKTANFKEYINVFLGRVQCFKCHNIAKHTEIYFGSLWFDVTSIGARSC
jgi:hypothetical protein